MNHPITPAVCDDCGTEVEGPAFELCIPCGAERRRQDEIEAEWARNMDLADLGAPFDHQSGQWA